MAEMDSDRSQKLGTEEATTVLGRGSGRPPLYLGWERGTNDGNYWKIICSI
jgi:hypothetical protein